MSERPGAVPTTGTGNEKQRTLTKSIFSPVFSHFPACASHTLMNCVLTEIQMRPRKPLPV